jgi:hypothetical protein
LAQRQATSQESDIKTLKPPHGEFLLFFPTFAIYSSTIVFQSIKERIRVRAQRRKGKANVVVLKLLRKHFGSPARIVKGMASTIKIVEIEE